MAEFGVGWDELNAAIVEAESGNPDSFIALIQRVATIITDEPDVPIDK